MTEAGRLEPAAEEGQLDAALRALAHPRRRAMLRLVLGGERTATELAAAAGASGPDASRHLKVLREAGLLTMRAERTTRLYRLDPTRLWEVRALLDGFWDDRLATLKVVAETMASEATERRGTA
ncbi:MULTISPECIES: helix-turn-helix transcriptional regulator [unclassified Pseudofrankia]|uniref:ArsR/SmtB family transcription factor n=1 Tax=unclassified Pseudofrankia TaxID=2994372 RepID=UPI0008DA3EE2|nr:MULTISPECIES: metalloregulator ArsR/SmtB family transcription factor [unclassified Pseudofrankia]MDT3442637.1 metalloregulator ArsR/SmtB family transcription factor [Pseudofrankia sp. BMG5.37]OHV65579.1 ArsR family transcriptional regulator [Pseudofrankia sp. BMG5.36]